MTHAQHETAMNDRFTFQSFGLRLLGAIVLIALTYNPEGYSYFHWALKHLTQFSALKAFAGVVLLIGWVVYLQATLRSLGPLGLVLAMAFFGTLIWLLVDFGLVPTHSVRAVSYLAMLMLAGILAIGMSWSHLWRRLSGQVDTDEKAD